MLALPKYPVKGMYVRHGNVVEWCGQRCEVFLHMHPGTSYESVGLVHESVAEVTRKHLEAEGNLSDLFEPRVLPELSEWQCQFHCFGLFKDGQLLGFWDMPVGWLSAAELVTSNDLEEGEFQAMLDGPRREKPAAVALPVPAGADQMAQAALAAAAAPDAPESCASIEPANAVAATPATAPAFAHSEQTTPTESAPVAAPATPAPETDPVAVAQSTTTSANGQEAPFADAAVPTSVEPAEAAPADPVVEPAATPGVAVAVTPEPAEPPMPATGTQGSLFPETPAKPKSAPKAKKRKAKAPHVKVPPERLPASMLGPLEYVDAGYTETAEPDEPGVPPISHNFESVPVEMDMAI